MVNGPRCPSVEDFEWPDEWILPQDRPHVPEAPIGQPSAPSAPDCLPAAQPPAYHDIGAGNNTPLPAQVVLAPLKIVHGLFGIFCKTVLAPVRATIGQQIPFSHRRHLVLLPERLEIFMGELTFFKVKSTEAILPETAGDSQLVRRVGRRIVAAVPRPGVDTLSKGYIAHLGEYQWEFIVVRSEQLNAFVVPGGKVVVYTGLLDLIDRDEDKLAAVLGHEAAHVVARHGAEGVGLRALLGGAGWMLCSAIGSLFSKAHSQYREEDLAEKLAEVDRRTRQGTPEHARAVALVRQEHEQSMMQAAELEEGFRKATGAGARLLMSLLVALPNSRRLECEADLIGLKIAAKAGFNIDCAPEVWDDFAHSAGGGGSALALLSTHPSNASRKQALLKEVQRMKELGWQKGWVREDMLDSIQPPTSGYFAI